jgi:hypothetical protein
MSERSAGRQRCGGAQLFTACRVATQACAPAQGGLCGRHGATLARGDLFLLRVGRLQHILCRGNGCPSASVWVARQVGRAANRSIVHSAHKDALLTGGQASLRWCKRGRRRRRRGAAASISRRGQQLSPWAGGGGGGGGHGGHRRHRSLGSFREQLVALLRRELAHQALRLNRRSVVQQPQL